MKKILTLITVVSLITASCVSESDNTTNITINNDTVVSPEITIGDGSTEFPDSIKIEGVALNPEGIEFNKNDQTFLLSSLNAEPIIKINLDGTYSSFTSGEEFPLSTAGLQIDYERNRLLVAGFNGTELFDEDPTTKGLSHLRIYNLETGVLEKDVNLSSLMPDAESYFANDIAVDTDGNAYVSDWYAGVIYKVDFEGNASVFWTNETGIPSGPNGLDFHKDGYLLASILIVDDKWLYADFGLIKIPVNDPKSATVVNISNSSFTGFDGMVINSDGNVVGITNDGLFPGGNTFIELSSKNDWETAEEVNKIAINGSSTVAVTPGNKQYVINQDFSDDFSESWKIERIKF